MALFNTKIEFIGSGKIQANVDTILFEDTYLTSTLAVAEAGHADLDVRFVSNSILGALNELLDGLVETSGNVDVNVQCYTESVDTAAFVHTLTHGLGTLDLMVQMYDANPASGPVANNIITCWTPTDSNNVRIELDASASGHFVVFGCPS
jgi:predicted urease superfamily metal-dependent hydrolase